MKPLKSLLLHAALLPAFALAQEGYPLDGTWRGQWGPEATTAVVVMGWDGTRIEGRINPGRNTSNFTAATLDASQWTVHIEAVTREGQSIVIEGTLADLGSYHRTLTGTWTVDGTAYPLTLTRE